MVTHSVTAASHAKRTLFLRDGMIYHQLYRGQRTREEMFAQISHTLTVMTCGGKEQDHE
jgi:putative ABC transport system ATP-binding protein